MILWVLRCDKDGQEFGSETALSMHLKDKHGIIDVTEISKATIKANSASYKLFHVIKERRELIIEAFLVIVIILSISFIISQYSAPAIDYGGMGSGMLAGMS